MFTDMVNVSDEALVMQVVKYYFPRWDKGEEVVEENGSEESSEIGSRHSGGAEKGERLTCSRTSSAFYDYCRKVKDARESPFRTKWDEKLQGVAIRRHKEEMEDEEIKKREDATSKESNAENGRRIFDADMVNGCWGGSYGVEELPTLAAQV
jgi:hypothetical protein